MCRMFFLFLLLFSLSSTVMADPAKLGWDDCFAGTNTSVKMTVNTVYGQVFPNGAQTYLNLTVLGTTPTPIVNSMDGSSKLSTLFTTTSILTLNAWSNFSSLCDTLRPPSPLPSISANDTDGYCPIGPGEFAFSTTIPWGDNRALTTLTTRISAVDPLTQELICIDVDTTPLDPSAGNPYGKAHSFFWATVALAILYWLLVGLARIVSAWDRGITRQGKGIWGRAQSAGFILASAISGERLATSPALLRFCTPSMRDIIFHTQWCAILSMVAVQWPTFVYPLLSQTAWATLTYNVTLRNSDNPRWNPLATAPYNPPSSFSDQLNDSSSVLFIDPSVSNILFTLPQNNITSAGAGYHNLVGIAKFAYSVGIRPQDLFPVCLILWLGVVAGTIALSLVIWFLDEIVGVGSGIIGGRRSNGFGSSRGLSAAGTRSPAFGSKDLVADTTSNTGGGTSEEGKALTGGNNINTLNSNGGQNLSRPPSRFGLATPTMSGGMSKSNPLKALNKWWKRRRRALVGGDAYGPGGSKSLSSFHGSVLHGNLVRVLVLFHLPITVFSVWHMLLPTSSSLSAQTSSFDFPDFLTPITVSTTSKALAGLSFALLSLLIPMLLTLRIRITPTNKLYEETRTLLSLGPLYNHYRPSSQMFFATQFFLVNIVLGVVVGAGQSIHSDGTSTSGGTAQAIVILILEVFTALVTSIWIPWGTGASMGLISFLFCVSRIIIAVLLVILTPAISIGRGAAGWVAYGVLVVLCLGYVGLVGMFIVKVLEGLLRIGAGVGFDHNSAIGGVPGSGGKTGGGGRGGRRGGYVDTGLLGVIGVISGGGRRGRNGRRSASNKGTGGGHYMKASTGTTSAAGMRNSMASSTLMSPVTPVSTAAGPFGIAMGMAHHNGSHKGSLGGASSHSGPPPSVLRPEHALTPYKEREDYDFDYDSEGYDSEGAIAMNAAGGTGSGARNGKGKSGGFIMGAWQPSGYVPVETQTQQQQNQAQTQTQTPAKSGFSRVGGGRANMDSPYAIQQQANANGSGSGSGLGANAYANPNTSTHQFPSFGATATALNNPSPISATASGSLPSHQRQQRNSTSTAPTGATGGRDSPPLPMSQAPPPSTTQDQSQLPPGAMPPFHIRTKSQTAIIVNSYEDYSRSQAELTNASQDDIGIVIGSGSKGAEGRGAGSGDISAPGTPRIHSHSYSAGSGSVATIGLGGGSSSRPGSRPPSRVNQLTVDSPDTGRGNSSGSGSGSAASAPPTSFRRRSHTQLSDDVDDDGSEGKKKKGKWGFLKRHRAHSTEGLSSPPSAFSVRRPGSAGSGDAGGRVDDELAGSQSSPGRTFVVIRKPQVSPARSFQQQSASGAGSSGSPS
ncbi:hypothetical protein D9758_004142 [Tetrapyrgos nigripes]|uniref:TRP C-terminal domain-containing protein n=1 Tax=Tetrapyrgos nigripes TaxID=182062 RepID=A0A8H5GUF4_9AGAR|nr:hypothetical protein D9758_004142 [Tetrapyrgos nigripes]